MFSVFDSQQQAAATQKPRVLVVVVLFILNQGFGVGDYRSMSTLNTRPLLFPGCITAAVRASNEYVRTRVRIRIRSIAKNRYTYAFRAINRYTAHCALEKASWRRLVFGMRSIVPTNGSKGQVHLLLATQLPSHLLLASTVPVNGSNDHFFATKT